MGRSLANLARGVLAAGTLASSACLDTTASADQLELLPTHHAIVYGTVRSADGKPVAGATVTPTIAQICPCYAVNVYVLEGTQPTSATGQYRIVYEAALPTSSRLPTRIAIRLEVKPSGAGAAAATADAPLPVSLTLPLDSARVDVVLK